MDSKQAAGTCLLLNNLSKTAKKAVWDDSRQPTERPTVQPTNSTSLIKRASHCVVINGVVAYMLRVCCVYVACMLRVCCVYVAYMLRVCCVYVACRDKNVVQSETLASQMALH